MRNVRGYLSRHRTAATFLLLLAVSITTMSLTTEADIVAPKRVGNAAVSLVQKGAAGIGGFVRRFFTSVGELRQLRSRYTELQEQLIRYRRDERELVRLRQDNTRLRKLLGLSEATEREHLLAEVIGNDPSSFFNALVINKGRVHGVRADMPVVAYQDGFQGLVGKIVSVGPVTAQVLPLFDARSFVPSRLQSSRYSGLIQGTGNRFSLLAMAYVPKSAADFVAVGDLVVTSGLSTIYPKDVYIGRVRGVSAKSWEASLTLDVEPIIDFSRLEYVFVLFVSSGASE